MNVHAHYASAPAHKLLTDNRDRYIEQSTQCKDGIVPNIPAPPYSPDRRGNLAQERLNHKITKASRDAWRVFALVCVAGYVAQAINVYYFGVQL